MGCRPMNEDRLFAGGAFAIVTFGVLLILSIIAGIAWLLAGMVGVAIVAGMTLVSLFIGLVVGLYIPEEAIGP